eukprot:TRINITY_DN154_c0_g1_i1.p1 TRINITY_DN154_c0_g1~~TRINITY_DN154_c0_g1_i1.p1  ORF type:complete len:211 (+),score=70.11 TRINITY_DN154_c0_g1_i1:38-634(+)
MKITDAQLGTLRASFTKYDVGHDGKISPNDMKAVLKDINYDTSNLDEDADKAVKLLDLNGDGSVSFVEFLRALTILSADSIAEVEVDDIVAHFLRTLRKQNPTDIIRYEPTATIAKMVGIPEETLKKYKETFERIDADKNGSIDFNEFKQEAVRLGLKDFDEAKLKAKFDQKDLDRDGKVSWEEFVEAMLLYGEKKKL